MTFFAETSSHGKLQDKEETPYSTSHWENKIRLSQLFS